MGIWKKFVDYMDINGKEKEPKFISVLLKIFGWIFWIVVVIFIIYSLSDFSLDKIVCKEETFYVESSIGCFTKCQSKCSNEGYGFDGNEGFTSYFYYPNADYPDNELRRCECQCSSEGC